MDKNFITNIIDKDLESGKVKNVYTRFPPEPNGYLHIGHAKAICLNFGIKQEYKGKCNLRFDDTNPTKEDVEYVDSIIEDIKWLGFDYDGLYYASDYFDQIYECAIKLIKKGLAYVCDLTAEQIKEDRGTLTEPGKNSPYRNRSVEENLQLFEEMKAGKYQNGEKVLRAKIDMASPNINMRDPVIYRILHASHHRTKDKWCIYPMYDLTHPISDAIEGITHSICTLEFEDHRPLYDWVTYNCDFANPPQQIEFARLNLTNTVMSKRFLKRLVDTKMVDGWDDPRMPTICGIRRRGYPAEAVRNFCATVGVAKANSEVDFAMLKFQVRDFLNQNAERAMAVTNPILINLTNYDMTESLDFEINPNSEEKVCRKIEFSNQVYIDGADFAENPPPKYHRLTPGGVVRLKSAYIIRCDEVVKDEKGQILQINCSVVANSKSGQDTSGVKCKGVIGWVNAKTCKDIKIYKYYDLLDENIQAEDFIEKVNKNSLHIFDAKAEPYIAECKKGDKFQFMRMGYYVCDDDKKFIEIVELKDSFGK